MLSLLSIHKLKFRKRVNEYQYHIPGIGSATLLIVETTANGVRRSVLEKIIANIATVLEMRNVLTRWKKPTENWCTTQIGPEKRNR